MHCIFIFFSSVQICLSLLTTHILQVRPRARRLIHSVLVNHEYDLLEARVNMLKDVVDVFVLQVKQNIKIQTVFETYCCMHTYNKTKNNIFYLL